MSDTNNLIESYHHQLKYVHARGRRCGRMDDFVKLMCHTVWPAYIACRESRVLEAERSRAERADEVHDHAVDYLTTAYGALEVVDEALGAGSCVAEVHNAGELVPPHVAFVVDCSCQCAVSRKDVCVHTEALAQRCPLNLEMMRLGAEEIGEPPPRRLHQPSHLQHFSLFKLTFFTPFLPHPRAPRACQDCRRHARR